MIYYNFNFIIDAQIYTRPKLIFKIKIKFTDRFKQPNLTKKNQFILFMQEKSSHNPN